MSKRDRVLGAISWWIGIVGLAAGLMSLNPPMHPAARRHCLLGFAGNVVLIMLRIWLNALLSPEIASAVVVVAGCFWFVIALVNTISAAMGRDVFFLDAITNQKPSWPSV